MGKEGGAQKDKQGITSTSYSSSEENEELMYPHPAEERIGNNMRRRKRRTPTPSPVRAPRGSSPPATPRIPRTTFVISQWLQGRVLGFFFFLFFYTLYEQGPGLLGENGISPISAFLSLAANSGEKWPFWRYPSLFWLRPTGAGRMLSPLLVGGMVCSGALFLQILPGLALFLCWLLTLSVVSVGQEFFPLIGDKLLLESAFLYALITIVRRHSSVSPLRMGWGEWLVQMGTRLLIIRILMVNGMVHFLGTDRTWQSLTYFERYFSVQPLPTLLSWSANEWSHTIKQGLVLGQMAVELPMPLLLVGGALFRRTAVFYIICLQLVYLLAGNGSGAFPYLLISLCVCQLDDAAWCTLPWVTKALLRSRANTRSKANKARSRETRTRRRVRKAIAGGTVLVFVLWLSLTLVPWSAATVGRVQVPEPLREWNTFFYPFRLANLYTSATLPRHHVEVLLQGSDDAHDWSEIGTLTSPDFDLNRPPPFPSPLVSRLELRMWTAGYSTYEREIWLSRLLHGLLAAHEPMWRLMGKSQFSPDHPPQYIRAVRYLYEFASDGPMKGTEESEFVEQRGEWWNRRQLDIFTPSFSQPLHLFSEQRRDLRSRRNSRA